MNLCLAMENFTTRIFGKYCGLERKDLRVHTLFYPHVCQFFLCVFFLSFVVRVGWSYGFCLDAHLFRQNLGIEKHGVIFGLYSS